MKKRFCAGICILIALIAALTFSACGLFSAGLPDGNSPYNAAVQEGYTGSEGQWLEEQQTPSTVYRRMWEEAVADGSFSGTYYEFLQSLDLSEDSLGLQKALLSSVSIYSHMTGSTGGSAGSGVIYSLEKSSGDAYVVTNYHVAYNATMRKIYDEFDLHLYGGELDVNTLSASFVGGSMEHDIAVLAIKGSEKVSSVTSSGISSHTNAEVLRASAAIPAVLGDSDSLLVGEKVYAIGNPEAWGISLVSGVVSVDAEYVEMTSIDGAGSVNMLEIRTDAAVNHGNSGGGLFNGAGELVGIVNARSELEGVEGIGYAIPANTAIAVAKNVIENGGTLRSAKLGITVQTTDSRSVYDETSGKTFLSETITIKEVTAGGAAYSARLDVGDTLISMTLNGKKTSLTRRHKVSCVLLGVRKGDTLTVEVSRGGVLMSFRVVFNQDSYFSEK